MRANQVDLNLLVALGALLTERNVTRAAERLHLGQPAMSASLARLRSVYDDPLLVRSGRTMSLTPLAQSLVERVSDLLVGIEQVLSTRAAFDPGSDYRTFTLMASDYATMVLLCHVLESLDAEAPNLRVIIQPLAANFTDFLQRGEIDFLLAPRELISDGAGQPQRPLFEDRFVCVVWEKNADVGEVVDEELFSKLPHLGYSGSPKRSLADIWLDTTGVERNIEATTQNFVLFPLLVRGTRLVSVVHERVAMELQPIARCRILPLPFDLPPIHETLYWHPRFDADPGHRWLRERIASVAASLD